MILITSIDHEILYDDIIYIQYIYAISFTILKNKKMYLILLLNNDKI